MNEQICVQIMSQHIGVVVHFLSPSLLQRLGSWQKDAFLPVSMKGGAERLGWGSAIKVCIDGKEKQSREPELYKSALGFTSHFPGLF